jgi:hypothetical protein
MKKPFLGLSQSPYSAATVRFAPLVSLHIQANWRKQQPDL